MVRVIKDDIKLTVTPSNVVPTNSFNRTPDAQTISATLTGGKTGEHVGWKSVSVTRSMETIASSFSLTYHDRWLDSDAPFSIRKGDACSIQVNKQDVLTGYVDECEVNYSASEHTLTVGGRSKAGDLVDCSMQHASGSWKNLKLDALAKIACEPFGINVTVADGVDLGAPFVDPPYTIQEGETAFEFMERAAKERGLLFTSTASGDVLIETASRKSSGGKLIFGENILTGQFAEDNKERYSVYLVKTQQKETDKGYGKANITAHNSARDAGVTRYRPLTVLAENGTTLANIEKRALWEANVRAARSVKYTYTVPGWTIDGKKLWQPNTLATVLDPIARIGEDLLITSVTFTRDDKGTVTQLQLMDKDAFSLTPIKARPNRDPSKEEWSAMMRRIGYLDAAGKIR